MKKVFVLFFQDAPEGIHKPSEGQFNKLSSSATAEPTTNNSAASRRSSSAPTNHYPSSLRDDRQATVTSVMGQSTLTEKTNAETQTAIRGVAIMESGCGHAPSSDGGSVSAVVAEETLFFTECESCKQPCKQPRLSTTTSPPPAVPIKTTTQQNKNQFHEKFDKRKQFSSTPNVAVTSSGSGNNISIRTSRKETLPKRNQTRPSVRKHSLSPTRQQYSELPGSPDNNQLDLPEKSSDRNKVRTKRSNTVVSPIHNHRKM